MNTIISLFRGQHRSKDRFIRLLRPHVEAMYRMAYRWTKNQHNAEDLVQEVLTRLASRLDELEAVDKLRPWLLKVLYREFVDQHRKQSRRLEVVESELSSCSGDGDTQQSILEYSTEPGIEQRYSIEQQVELALASLDDDQSDVLLLHDAEGYTDSETAEILAISKGTVKSRLHRARKKIKKILS